MGDPNPLQFDQTLKQLSMTTLIAYIYEQPDVKEKMREVIRTKYLTQKKADFPVKSIKKEIIKLASLKIKTLDLTKNLISDVQGMLIFFAKKIASYAEFVIKTLKLDVPYLDRIYWTVLGTIDDAKIFDEYWKNHKSFSKIMKSDTNNVSFLSVMACKYAHEEIIRAHQNVMIKLVQKSLRNEVQLPNIENKIEQIIAAYTCFLYGEGYDMTHRTDVNRKFKETGNPSIQDIIFMCDGNAKCIKFLWSFLNSAEKDWIIIQLAYDNLRKGLFSCNFDFKRSDPDSNEFETFRLAGYAEAVLFLLNEMSPEQKSEFLMHCSSNVMGLFLRIWPYHEICLKMLNDATISEIIAQDSPELLYWILLRMVHDLNDLANVSGTCYYPSVFYNILKRILSFVPKEAKKKVLFNPCDYNRKGIKSPDVIKKFYHIFDLNALGIIINDKDLETERSLMISLGSDKISNLISKGNMKSVLSFIEKVLVSNVERRKFIKQWNLENNSLVANNPDFQEIVMCWLRVD